MREVAGALAWFAAYLFGQELTVLIRRYMP